MARKSQSNKNNVNDFSSMIVPINKPAKAKPAKTKKKSSPKTKPTPLKPEIIGPYGSEMNQIMDALLDFVNDMAEIVDNDDIEVEDVAEFQKEKSDYSKIDFIPYKEELFCTERIIKIFKNNSIKVEESGKNSFIAKLESNGKILVKNSSHTEMIRLEIPIVFKPKVSKVKKLEFLNQLNNEIAILRFLLEDDGKGVACIEMDYTFGLNIRQLLYFVDVLESITYEIYTEWDKNLLDPIEVGIYFD